MIERRLVRISGGNWFKFEIDVFESGNLQSLA